MTAIVIPHSGPASWLHDVVSFTGDGRFITIAWLERGYRYSARFYSGENRVVLVEDINDADDMRKA